MTSIRFLGDLPPWLGILLALAASAAAWLTYRRERHDMPGRLRTVLPLLRTGAVFLAVLVLTGPVLHHRRIVGQLGRVLVFLDGSASMDTVDRHMPAKRKLLIARQQGTLAADDADPAQLEASGDPAAAAAIAQFDTTSRWQRAETSLLDPGRGLLRQLAQTHDIELLELSGSKAKSLWDRFASAEPPAALKREPAAPLTDLAGGIAGRMAERQIGEPAAARSEDAAARTAVVLLTDGRHNSGISPMQTASLLGRQGIPLFPVGYGSQQEPPDLAILRVECPDTVFSKDRVRGALVVKDQMPAGQSFMAQIGLGSEIVWQQQCTTEGSTSRRIEFDFPIDKLVERLRVSADGDVEHYAVPLALEALLVPLEGETESSNNAAAFRIAAITRKNRILLIDGRSRWETRYLRNAFERDEQWQVDTILAGPGTDQPSLPRGEGPGRFPPDKESLFQYDLILYGDVPGDLFAEHERQWIRDFVEQRGGGLIFIDGGRGHLRMTEGDPLFPLLPVSHQAGPAASATRLELTPRGAGISALMLQATPEANARFWQKLPPPRAITPVEALADTETLVQAAVGEKLLPAMVTRTFGAGRVFYSAFDETWRWRYKAADTYHQRFWNQLVQWTMPRPYAVRDQYAALDSGPLSYALGDRAEIRAQLRGVDGRPVANATVDALLWQDGRIVSTASLAADESASGVYRGQTGPLAEGEYEVSIRASGFSSDAMKARTRFTVRPPASPEFEQTSCNDNLLTEMAAASGGRFLREEQIDELAELLKPLSSGRVVESDTLLWQSYWWFAAIVALVSLEWLLRKRAGLL